MRFAVALLALAACASDEATELDYAKSAKANYEKGKAELGDGNYLEAVKYFTYVKNKFPFSQYAAYAELRVADTHMADDKYLEAIDGYRLFTRGHPTHVEVTSGYVGYRTCEAYVLQMPEDWFLVPPAYERDQSAARDALRELRDFLRDYPESPYRPKADVFLHQVIRRLADYDLYAARFYMARDRPKAAASRLEGLLSQYPESGMDGEVLLLLGQTYLEMGDGRQAEGTFDRLRARAPGSAWARKAQLYLDFMRKNGY